LTEDPSEPDSVQPALTVRRRRVRFAIGTATIVLFAIVGRRHLGELHRLAHASLPLVMAMFVCVVLARIGQARTIQILLVVLSHAVRFRDVFMASNLTGFSNLFVPRSGVGAAAFYFNRKHRVPYSDYGSLTVFLALVDAVATGIIGLASLGLVTMATGMPFHPQIAIAFAAAVLGGIVAIRLRVDLSGWFGGWLARILQSLADGWRALSKRRSAVVRVLAIRLALLLLSALRLQLAFAALAVDVPFLGVLLAAMLGSLAQISSITPAGIGIREAAIAFAATVVGSSPASSLAAAVLDRLVTTLLLIALGEVSLWGSLTDSETDEKGGA